MREAIAFGKYLLLDRISVGGMAEVFRAKSYGVEGFEKLIAIKRILPSMGEDRDFIKMFIDEAKIAGQLSHPNIGQIFELGKVEASHYIAMEYIWGKDLLQIQNRCKRRGETLPLAMTCFVVAKAAEGLDYAHRKRDALGKPLEIVHRDCSPQNVLISYEGEVKIIDFGIARAASRSSRTSAGVLKGKFGYMSPEQVRGLPLDHRSDIFALGTVLYECLTGDRLFQGESDFSTLEKVRNADVRRPSQLRSDIPPELERIVMKALARDPRSRYEWAGEMGDDLVRYLTQQATPYSAKVLGDWLRRVFDQDLVRERVQLDAFRGAAAPSEIPAEGDSAAGALDEVESDTGRMASLGGFEEQLTEINDEGLAAMLAAEAVPPFGAAQLAFEGPRPAPPYAPAVVAAPALAERPPSYPVEPTPAPIEGWPPAASPHGTAPGGFGALPPSYYPGTGRTPRPTVAPRRSGVGREIGLALAIAALVLGAVVTVRFLWLAERVPEARASAETGTIAVMTGDDLPADVTLDGVAVGVTRDRAPLTLEGLSPGEHRVVVSRIGAAPCEQAVTLGARKVEMAICAPASRGRLRLVGVEPGHVVLVDEQAISDEAAREPIQLSPGTHSIVIRSGDDAIDQFEVEIAAGQNIDHVVLAAPLPPRRATTEPTERRGQGSNGAGRVTERAPPRDGSRTHSRDLVEPDFDDRLVKPIAGGAAERDKPTNKVGPSASQAVGHLTAFTQPWARVFVDGKDSGKMTPIAPRSAIPLSPGSHKVTFVVGDQRFSFPVVIEAGKTKNLVKELAVAK